MELHYNHNGVMITSHHHSNGARTMRVSDLSDTIYEMRLPHGVTIRATERRNSLRFYYRVHIQCEVYVEAMRHLVTDSESVIQLYIRLIRKIAETRDTLYDTPHLWSVSGAILKSHKNLPAMIRSQRDGEVFFVYDPFLKINRYLCTHLNKDRGRILQEASDEIMDQINQTKVSCEDIIQSLRKVTRK